MGMYTDLYLKIKKTSDSKESEVFLESKVPERDIKDFLKREGLESLTEAALKCFDKAVDSYRESEKRRVEFIRSEFPPLEWEWEYDKNKGAWAEERAVYVPGYIISSSVTGDDHIDGVIWEEYFSDGDVIE